jgi:hypothetical protein
MSDKLVETVCRVGRPRARLQGRVGADPTRRQAGHWAGDEAPEMAPDFLARSDLRRVHVRGCTRRSLSVGATAADSVGAHPNRQALLPR